MSQAKHTGNIPGRKGFAAELLRSHLLVASIGLGMLLVALILSFFLRMRATVVAKEAEPAARSSAKVLTEVHHSLAGLRGWVSLGDKGLLEEWELAWSGGIEPAIASLNRHMNFLKRSGSEKLLDQLLPLMAELKESQWWVQAVAQTPGNEPAKVSYAFEVEPVAFALDSIFVSLVREAAAGAGSAKKERLVQLAEAQRSFLVARILLESILFEGSLHMEQAFRDNLGFSKAICSRLVSERSFSSTEQGRLMQFWQRESQAFERLAEKAIARRKSDRWNVAQHLMATETVPLAKGVTALALELASASAAQMRQHSSVVARTTNIGILAMVVLIGSMIIVAVTLSRKQAQILTQPVAALSKGAQEFASGQLSDDIPVMSDNELGNLTRSFNYMRASLEKAQEELIRKEKLAILGELSGGVGHELRNPLGVISNAVYFLKTIHPDADETTREYLEIISSEVDNAEKITADLLDFKGTRTPERQEVPAADLVSQAMARLSPPEGIEVTTAVAPDLSPVYVDPRQIRQVLNNLITNACHAMPEGGRLTVRVQGEGGLEAEPMKEVRFSIEDTGQGILREDLTMVFEPLYTTKARGIGLGLTITKNLVQNNGGSITVKSDPGRGSTFTVILPTKESPI